MRHNINQKIGISQRRALVRSPLLIEGSSRSGKFLLGNILDGFQRVDHYQAVSILDHVPFLERFKLISKEAAVSFVQMAIDESAYHAQIGRNLNLKQSDKSSLHNSFEKSVYLKRMKSAGNAEAIKNLKRANYYNPFIIHEGMPNIKIFFEAYPSVKIISIIRHPADIIHSWYLRGWGKRETTDALSFQPCITMAGKSIPWYAYRHLEGYVQLNRMDRVIRVVSSLFDMSIETFQTLAPQQQRQILFVTYEDLVVNTHDVLKQIAVFLKTKPSSIMSKILARECCPNKGANKNRSQKIKDLRKRASKKTFKSLLCFIERYEKHKENLFLAKRQ